MEGSLQNLSESDMKNALSFSNDPQTNAKKMTKQKRHHKNASAPSSNKSCNCEITQLVHSVETLKGDMTKMFKTLTSSIFQMRKEIQEFKLNSTTNNVTNVFMDKTLPCPTLEDLMVFEESLVNDSEKFEELQNTFLQCRREEPVKFIRENLRMIFLDEVAKEYSWIGKKTKMAARTLRIVQALKNAFMQNYPQNSEDFFNKHCMRYFQYANDRIVKKQKYNSLQVVGYETTWISS